jgi:hypothetical protein
MFEVTAGPERTLTRESHQCRQLAQKKKAASMAIEEVAPT